MTASSPNPATSTERIPELDVLRGFAVLGIFWVNVIVFGIPADVYSNPILYQNGHVANLYAWVITDVFVEGSMRALFSMLFGASAIIILKSTHDVMPSTQVVDQFYRRNLLLIAFGMFHAYVLLAPYEVLYIYGLLGMFIFPLRKLSPRVLLIIGCLMLALVDVSMPTASNTSDSDEDAYVTATTQTNKQLDELRYQMQTDIYEETQLRRSDYSTIFLRQLPTVGYEHSIAVYSTNLFDVGGMMLIGIALFKLGILSGYRSRRFYLLLALIAYSAGIAVRGLPVYNTLTMQNISTGIPLFNEVADNLARLAIALGHMSLVLLLFQSQNANWLKKALTPVGKMALTSYLLQTCVAIFIFYGFGLGLFGQLERYQLIYICLGMWLFLIIFSRLWLRYFRQGPLEWLWRSLIYSQAQPFRRNQPETESA